MKVTVCFGDVRVVVPCGNGSCHVKDLVDDAIARYHKVLAKSADVGWLSVNTVRLLTSDGGILDPDDRVSDVVDDREQLIAIHEEDGGLLGNRHQNNGDGTSDGSFGTSSPDSFREVVSDVTADVSNRQSAPLVGRLKPEEDCDVIVTSQDLNTECKLRVRRGSEPTLCVSDTSSNCSTDCTVVSALQQIQLQYKTTTDAAPVSPHKVGRKEPVGSSTGSKVVQNGHVLNNDVKLTVGSQMTNGVSSGSFGQEMVVEFPKSTDPLGIHVIPEFDQYGRNIGLTVQSLEVGGRADIDGRLHCGDRITDINRTALLGKDFNEAQEVFRKGLQSSHLQLIVVRCAQPVVSAKAGHHTPSTSGASATPSSDDGSHLSSKKAAPPVPVRKSVQPLSDNNNNNACIVNKKMTIELIKGDEGLGFTITTKASQDVGRCLVYVKTIMPNGAAVQDGQLKAGDLLLEINGHSMTDKTQNDVVALLRNTPPGGKVRLVISRQVVGNTIPVVQKLSIVGTQQPRPLSAHSLSEMNQDESGNVSVVQDRAVQPYADEDISSALQSDRESEKSEATSHSAGDRMVDVRTEVGVSRVAAGASVATPSDQLSVHSELSSTSHDRMSSVRSGKTASDNMSEDFRLGSLDLAFESHQQGGSFRMPPTSGLTLGSRKSLSMDNLRDNEQPLKPGDMDDDNDDEGDDLAHRRPAVFVRNARNINQSFRVAVDKCYEGPSSSSSHLHLVAAGLKDAKDSKKKKNKKDEGKGGGLGRFFRFSRHRSKSVPRKSESGNQPGETGHPVNVNLTVNAHQPQEFMSAQQPAGLHSKTSSDVSAHSTRAQPLQPNIHPPAALHRSNADLHAANGIQPSSNIYQEVYQHNLHQPKAPVEMKRNDMNAPKLSKASGDAWFQPSPAGQQVRAGQRSQTVHSPPPVSSSYYPSRVPGPEPQTHRITVGPELQPPRKHPQQQVPHTEWNPVPSSQRTDGYNQHMTKSSAIGQYSGEVPFADRIVRRPEGNGSPSRSAVPAVVGRPDIYRKVLPEPSHISRDDNPRTNFADRGRGTVPQRGLSTDNDRQSPVRRVDDHWDRYTRNGPVPESAVNPVPFTAGVVHRQTVPSDPNSYQYKNQILSNNVHQNVDVYRQRIADSDNVHHVPGRDEYRYRVPPSEPVSYNRQPNQRPRGDSAEQYGRALQHRQMPAAAGTSHILRTNPSNCNEDPYWSRDANADIHHHRAPDSSPTIRYHSANPMPVSNSNMYGPPRLAQPSHPSQWS